MYPKTYSLQVLNTNDETRNNVADEVSELSVPGTHFDWQPDAHHMVTDRTAQKYQISRFLAGRILTSNDPSSHQHQIRSTHKSQDNNLPMVEHTPRNQSSDSKSSINRHCRNCNPAMTTNSYNPNISIHKQIDFWIMKTRI